MLSKKRKFNNISYNEDHNCEGIIYGLKKKQKIDLDDDVNMTDKNSEIFVIGNEIHFTCGITKKTIQEMINNISLLIHNHKEESNGVPEQLTITYIVDSPGGQVTAVLKFVDYLNIVRKKYNWVKFVSIISGMTASAGTIMAIVADERYITENAYAMIHELSAGNNTKYTQLLSYMDYLSKLHVALVNIYCKTTKKTQEEIETLLRKETWFSATEYYDNGFVDGIKNGSNDI